MKNFSIDFERVFNDIEIGIYINDTDGNIISFNTKAKELFVSTFEKLSLNESTSEVSLIKLLINAKKHFTSPDVLTTKKPVYNRKVKYIDENDETHLFIINSVPINNTEGESSEVFNTIINLDKGAAPEDPLKETTRSIEVVLYSMNSDTEKYFLIAGAVEKIFGYTTEEIIQDPLLAINQIHQDDLQNYNDFTAQLKKGIHSVTEYRIKDIKGEVRYLRNSGYPVTAENNFIRIDGIISDITKDKNFQVKLAESEERFRLLIETASDLIFNLDNYGYFVMVNSSGALFLGYKTEEMIGRHFLEFVNEDYKSSIAVSFQQILKSDKVNLFEAVLQNKSGKNLFFEIHGRPIKKNNEIVGLLGIGRDITERRKVEEKLKELNAKLIEANRIISVERDRAKNQVNVLEEVNRLKSDFISNISHELRTPLASIVGFSETISNDPDLPKEMVIEFNNIILSEGKRLARLINDFLDFAKIEAGKMDLNKSIFNASELLREIINKIRPAAEEKGVIITSEIPDKDIILFSDKERIGQVFNQLISNAVKFTDRGGRVSIIGQDFLKEFEFIVSDTGIGIPEAERKKIFQKFFKVENPGTMNTGTGIGLGLAKQIIDLHRGLITVQSEVNKGTTFIVRLPKMTQINK
jgi:PAS domain S-box-containing protein